MGGLSLRWRPWMAVALAVLLAASAGMAWFGLGALEAARGRLDELQARVRAGGSPARPLLPAELSHGERDRVIAEAAMVAVIRGAAAERHLLVERIAGVAPDRERPATLAVELIMSGPEADLFAAIRSIEAARPTIRFARWRIGRTGPAETAIRFDGRALSVWEPR